MGQSTTARGSSFTRYGEFQDETNLLQWIVGVAVLALTVIAATSKPDLEMKTVLDALASLGGKPIETLSPEEARKQPTPADAVKEVLEGQGKCISPQPVASVDNRSIPGPLHADERTPS